MELDQFMGGSGPGPYKILFAGGCHVDKATPEGYTTLSTVAMQVLAEHGIVCNPEYLIQVRLAHFRRVAQKCADFAPDILVLQPGHPEVMRLVAAYLLKRFKLTRYCERLSRSTASPPMRFDSLRDRIRWRVRSALKTAIHIAAGRRLLDVEDFQLKLANFFARVKAARVPHVVVLGPLPCADPIPMYYRTVIAPLLRSAALTYGFEYLDVIGMGNSTWYRDPNHLNQKGHRIVGEILGRFLICSPLRRCAPAAAVPIGAVETPENRPAHAVN